MNNISNINPAIFAKRKRTNKIGLTLSMGAMGLGMIFLLNLSQYLEPGLLT